jgi:hypothetical protein
MSTAMARLRAALALLMLAAGLPACGPGVGGSGTGQGLEAFGAVAAPLCGSELASALSCPPATVGSPAASAPSGANVGTAPVFLADTIDGRRVVVTVQGNSMDVDAPCARVRFSGQWGVLSGQAARFYGTNTDQGAVQPAQVRASLDSGGLVITVQDAAGNVLLGPVLVTARPAAATPGSC